MLLIRTLKDLLTYVLRFFPFLFKVFQGNIERNHVVFHKFRPSLKTRYVRIHPKSWYSYISMRVELFGCRLGKCAPSNPYNVFLD